MKLSMYRGGLLFALFGIALWFFGNLYEAVVITPNLLCSSARKIQNWQSFFDTTNPVFYYLPLAPLALLAAVLVYLRTPDSVKILKSQLRLAVVFGLLAFGLGLYIVTQINLRLFFDATPKPAADIYHLALLWNILNACRVVLLLISLVKLFQSYVWTQLSRTALEAAL